MPHRVVYAKSLTFRTFVDIQPKNDCLIFSIKSGRNVAVSTVPIRTMQEEEEIKSQIKDA